jgi:hypothetical protein
MRLYGLPEVHQSHLTMAQEHVLERNVPMAYAILVKVVNGLQQLPHPSHDLAHRQTAAIPLALLHHIKQISTVGMLQNQPSVSSALKHRVHPQNISRQITSPPQEAIDANFIQDVFGRTFPLRVVHFTFVSLLVHTGPNTGHRYTLHNHEAIMRICRMRLRKPTPTVQLNLSIRPAAIRQSFYFCELAV